MALSPASSLSSLTDDTPELTKDVDLENVYHLVSGVVRDLSLPGGSISLPSEAQIEMEKIEKLLVGGAYRPNHKVAVSGKSTLLNALLGCSVLSAADMGGACTSVVTEISYQEGSEAVATVLFKTRQQWETELRHLVTDVHDANNPDSLGKLANVCSRQDLKKMGTVEKQEMLPEQSKELESSLIDNLLDDPAVKDKLGNASTVSGTPKDIREKLKPFWGAATWPLIARVNIRGPFPVLSSGIVLADLPGHGDADIVRNKVADQYMQDANTIFLVAPINRAIDDEGVQNYLKKHISQSIIDGRIAEDSVVLVLTQHDVIGSNADTASSKDAEIEELTNQLKTHKSQKKQPKDSKHSRLPETRKLRASLGIASYVPETERIGGISVQQGRCLAVISALQHKYQSIYANVSGASAPPRPIPIFCVGSSDYLILHDHSPTKTAIFSSKSETGIPALYTHTMHIGERQGVSDAIHLLFLTYQLLNQSSITVEGDDEGSEIRLEKECEQEVASLVQSIEKMFAMIVDESSPLIDAAKQQSLHVFQAVAETHKWNQYLALMRRQGEFGSTNLNALLTSPIADSESLQRLWHVVFNEDIPRTVLHCMKSIHTAISSSVSNLRHRSVDKSLHSIETSVQDLSSTITKGITIQQRQARRIWAPLMKTRLSPQYASVAAITPGRNRFARMKSNESFIEGSAVPIFEALKAGIKGALAECVELVQAELQHRVRVIVRDVTVITADDKCPSFLAKVRADKEESIFEMMDSLKARVQ
ncbi:hypothetical protein R3P38DRAFT_2942002 [Favolaschia claudopus]|uniref:Dynamin N-terminal domain-containing protein n=1 Tax=Favolaschia claudopus TaxID=2862362 RepID=A0AAW0BLK0_9AGAR